MKKIIYNQTALELMVQGKRLSPFSFVELEIFDIEEINKKANLNLISVIDVKEESNGNILPEPNILEEETKAFKEENVLETDVQEIEDEGGVEQNAQD